MKREGLKKLLLYRILTILYTFILALILSSKFDFSLEFVIVDVFLSSLLYYAFEKFWKQIKKRDKKL